jgi:hypothetical protein
MGIIKTTLPAKFFCGFTFQPQVDVQDMIDQIERRFGALDLRSEIYDFSAFTNYYQPEMGTGLKKLFISFEQLQPQDFLPQLKLQANAFEAEFMSGGRRQFNMDPGYLTLAKVVLATTKDYSHRLYLGQGIFGDLHLFYSQKTFRSQPWTYPDYKQELAVNFFIQLREIYRQQLEFYLLASENT